MRSLSLFLMCTAASLIMLVFISKYVITQPRSSVAPNKPDIIVDNPTVLSNLTPTMGINAEAAVRLAESTGVRLTFVNENNNSIYILGDRVTWFRGEDAVFTRPVIWEMKDGKFISVTTADKAIISINDETLQIQSISFIGDVHLSRTAVEDSTTDIKE